MYATFLQNMRKKSKIRRTGVNIHFIISFKIEKKIWLFLGQQKLEEEILC